MSRETILIKDKGLYNQNLLIQINKGNMKYAFLYNGFGQRTQVKIDGRTTPIATYTYSASGRYVTKMQYGNGDCVDYSYDNLGRLIRMRETTDGGERLFVENSFDQYGRATKTTYKYGSSSGYYGITYKQNSDLVEWLRLPNYSKIQYTYDHLERISGMTVMSNSENFTYAGSIYEYSSGNGSNTTSDTIDKVTLRMTNTQFSYVYDDCNNITEIYKNNSLIRKYSYDDLQQMTKEVIIEPGATTGTQYDYVYDLHGNILSKTESTYTVATGVTSGSTTTQYTYGDNTWGDLLTSYGDLTFTYDEIGNLVSRHREGISSAYYFNWGKGRQLESLSYGTSAQSATTVVAHEYNSDGVRISRTFNAGGLEYIVDGDRILKQIGCGIGVLQTLEFYYDAQGEIIGFNYNGNDYYYGKNVQGDVVELYDRWSLIATYEYDAWGNLLSIKDANGNVIPDDINSTNVASINPIRYRGYYYDIEKGMYYLNSRYYWPKLGRFINADGYVSTGQDVLGTNMFAYCGNNPVNRKDPTGCFWEFVETLFTEIGNTFENMAPAFATCGGAAAADGLLPFGEIAVGILAIGCVAYGSYAAYKLPSFSVTKSKIFEEEKSIVAEKVGDDPPRREGQTYYHSTTIENAILIKASGTLIGSNSEGGYVYAWKYRPTKLACENGGAHLGVLISFKTNASFERDTGIYPNNIAYLFSPVVSTNRGPIAVWDVELVGYR